jgi:hypothetical protein
MSFFKADTRLAMKHDDRALDWRYIDLRLAFSMRLRIQKSRKVDWVGRITP